VDLNSEEEIARRNGQKERVLTVHMLVSGRRGGQVGKGSEGEHV
jgi:hypothetical protein